MLPAESTDIIRLTGDSSGSVSARDYTRRWDQNQPAVTQVTPDKNNEIEQLDLGIASLSGSIESLLHGFVSLLNDRRNLPHSDSFIDQLLKRYILAVVAVSFVDDARLDKSVALNLQLPYFPDDGFDELLDTIDGIRDFYSCVNDPTTAEPTVEVFSLNLKQS